MIDKVTIQPITTGPHGKVWRYDNVGARARIGRPAEHDATIESLIVEAAYAHPFWHSYWLSILHLRPMPGFADPIIHLPGATHEMMLFALDPKEPREPTIRGEADIARLEPVNYACQLILSNDVEAKAMVMMAAQDIVNGTLNPDTDFRQMWVQRFGDSMMKDRVKKH